MTLLLCATWELCSLRATITNAAALPPPLPFTPFIRMLQHPTNRRSPAAHPTHPGLLTNIASPPRLPTRGATSHRLLDPSPAPKHPAMGAREETESHRSSTGLSTRGLGSRSVNTGASQLHQYRHSPPRYPSPQPVDRRQGSPHALDLVNDRRLTDVTTAGTFVANDTIVAAVAVGGCVWTAESGGWLRTRDLVTGEIAHQQRLRSSPNEDVTCIAATHDKIWVGGNRGLLCVFRISDHKHVADCVLHESGITALCVQDGAVLATGTDGRLSIWANESLTCVSFLVVARGPVNCVTSCRRADLGMFTPTMPPGGVTTTRDATIVLCNGDDNVLNMWTTTDAAQLPSAVFRGHTAPILCVAVVGGNRLWTGSEDMSVRVWNPTTQSCLRELRHHRGAVHIVMAVPDDPKVWTASIDGTVALWDASTLTCLGDLPVSYPRDRPDHFIFAIAPVARAQVWRVWTSSTDGTVRSWLSQQDALTSPLNPANQPAAVIPPQLLEDLEAHRQEARAAMAECEALRLQIEMLEAHGRRTNSGLDLSGYHSTIAFMRNALALSESESFSRNGIMCDALLALSTISRLLTRTAVLESEDFRLKRHAFEDFGVRNVEHQLAVANQRIEACFREADEERRKLSEETARLNSAYDQAVQSENATRARLQQVTGDLESATHHNRSLQSVVSALTKECDDTKLSLHQTLQQLQRLEEDARVTSQEKDTLYAEVAELRGRDHESHREREGLQRRLSLEESLAKDKERTLTHERCAVRDVETALFRALAEGEETNRRLSHLKADIALKDSKLESYLSHLAALELELDDLKATRAEEAAENAESSLILKDETRLLRDTVERLTAELASSEQLGAARADEQQQQRLRSERCNAELTECHSEVGRLNDLNSQLRQEMLRQNKELDALQDQLRREKEFSGQDFAALMAKHSDLSEQLKTVRMQLHETGVAKAEAEAQRDETRAQFSSLQSSATELSLANRQLIEQLRTAVEKQLDEEKQVADRHRSLEALKLQLSQSTKQTEELTNHCLDLQRTIEATVHAKSALQREMSIANDKLAVQRAEIDILTSRSAKEAPAVAAIAEDCRRRAERIADLESTVVERDQRIEALLAAKLRADEDTRSALELNGELRAAVDAATRESKAAAASLAEVKSQHRAAMDDACDREHQLATHIGTLEREMRRLPALQEELLHKSQRIASLAQALDEADANVLVLRRQISAANRQQETVKADLDAVSEDRAVALVSLEEERSLHNCTRQDLKAARADLSQQREAFEASLALAHKELEILQRDRDAFHNKSAKTESTLGQLNERLKDDLTNTAAALRSTQVQLSSRDDEVRNLRDANLTYTRQIQSLEGDLASLQHKFDTAQMHAGDVARSGQAESDARWQSRLDEVKARKKQGDDQAAASIALLQSQLDAATNEARQWSSKYNALQREANQAAEERNRERLQLDQDRQTGDKQVDELKVVLKGTKQRAAEAEKKLESLTNDVALLREQRTQQEQERVALLRQLEDARAAQAAARQRLADAEKKVDGMSEELATFRVGQKSSSDAVKDLRDQLTRQRDALVEQHNVAAAGWQQQHRQQLQETKRLHDHASEVSQRQVSEAERAVADERAAHAATKERMRSDEQAHIIEATSLRFEIVEQSALIKSLRASTADAEKIRLAEVNRLRESITVLQESLDESRNTTVQLGQLADVEAERDAAKRKAAHLQAELVSLRESLHKSEVECSTHRVKWETIVRELADKSAALSATERTLKEALEAAEKKAADARRDLDLCTKTHNADVQNLHAEHERSRSSIMDRLRAMEVDVALVGDLRVELDQLQEALRVLQAERDADKRRIAELIDKLNVADNELASAMQVMQEQADTISQLSAKQASLAGENVTMQRKLEAAHQESVALRARIEALQHELEGKRNELQSMALRRQEEAGSLEQLQIKNAEQSKAIAILKDQAKKDGTAMSALQQRIDGSAADGRASNRATGSKARSASPSGTSS